MFEFEVKLRSSMTKYCCVRAVQVQHKIVFDVFEFEVNFRSRRRDVQVRNKSVRGAICLLSEEDGIWATRWEKLTEFG
jgi:hypothetical protein